MFLTTLLLSYAVGYATGYAVGAVIETIAELISPSTIQQGIRDRGAFYDVVKKKQPKVLTVDEIDRYGDSKEIVFKSEKGVSRDIYVGQKIYA